MAVYNRFTHIQLLQGVGSTHNKCGAHVNFQNTIAGELDKNDGDWNLPMD